MQSANSVSLCWMMRTSTAVGTASCKGFLYPPQAALPDCAYRRPLLAAASAPRALFFCTTPAHLLVPCALRLQLRAFCELRVLALDNAREHCHGPPAWVSWLRHRANSSWTDEMRYSGLGAGMGCKSCGSVLSGVMDKRDQGRDVSESESTSPAMVCVRDGVAQRHAAVCVGLVRGVARGGMVLLQSSCISRGRSALLYSRSSCASMRSSSGPTSPFPSAGSPLIPDHLSNSHALIFLGFPLYPPRTRWRASRRAAARRAWAVVRRVDARRRLKAVFASISMRVRAGVGAGAASWFLTVP